MKTLYIAHRGSKVFGGVENTKVAFLGGVKAKAFGLECDIRVTKDGVIVIYHDATLERLTKEDNIYHNVSVNDLTIDEVNSIELYQTYNGETHKGYICSFDEYLTICKENDIVPIIEFKWTNGIYSDNNNRDIYNYSNIDIVINKIKEYDLLDKCYIISFMAGCLEYVRKFYPNVSIQWLCTSTVVQDLDWCIKNRFDIDVHYSYMTKEIVDKCHANNLKVNIWTLNDESLLEKYLDMGVDMITSDFIIK